MGIINKKIGKMKTISILLVSLIASTVLSQGMLPTDNDVATCIQDILKTSVQVKVISQDISEYKSNPSTAEFFKIVRDAKALFEDIEVLEGACVNKKITYHHIFKYL